MNKPQHPEWVWYNYFIACYLVTAASCYGNCDVFASNQSATSSLLLFSCKMAGEDPVVSPGLSDIARPKCTKDTHRRFKLGLGKWTESSKDEKENNPPAPLKRLKLLKKPDEQWHFLTEVAESDLQQKYVAKNTS